MIHVWCILVSVLVDLDIVVEMVGVAVPVSVDMHGAIGVASAIDVRVLMDGDGIGMVVGVRDVSVGVAVVGVIGVVGMAGGLGRQPAGSDEHPHGSCGE